MSRDLLDIVGQIDEQYIEEASGRVLQEKKRPRWLAAAAVIALVLAAGAGGWMLRLALQRTKGPGTQNPVQAGTEAPHTVYDDPEQTNFNRLDIDFAAAAAAANDENFAAACQYAQGQEPSAKNDMTGLFAGKNLILITAQNFSPYVIDPVRTPTLYRLAKQGIEFTDYYQPDWEGAATSGEFAILTGLIPVHGVGSLLDTVGKAMPYTLGNQLRSQGYFSRAYTDDHSFDYLHRNETHPNLGYEELLGVGNGLDLVLTKQWPYSDRELMRVAVDQCVDMQPFSIYLMMCSGMGAYNRAGNAMAAKHWAEVEDLPYSDTVKAYLAANMEVEDALRDLVAALEKAGIAENTVIVLTSSQYPYALEKNEDYGNAEDYLAELCGEPVESCFRRDRSTLIIWSGCLEGKGYRVTSPTSSLDIVPTLSNLFGMEFDSRLLPGRDVFAAVPEDAPLVQWPDGSWIAAWGRYDASTHIFTQTAAQSEAPQDYADSVRKAAEERRRYCENLLNTDFYALLLPFCNEK